MQKELQNTNFFHSSLVSHAKQFSKVDGPMSVGNAFLNRLTCLATQFKIHNVLVMSVIEGGNIS